MIFVVLNTSFARTYRGDDPTPWICVMPSRHHVLLLSLHLFFISISSIERAIFFAEGLIWTRTRKHTSGHFVYLAITFKAVFISLDRLWKASLCHVNCISGLTLFLDTSSVDLRRCVRSTSFTT